MTDETLVSQADHLTFETIINDSIHSFRDPIVTAERILEAVRQFPTDEHLVFQLLQNGQLGELRRDEMVDLRSPGREKFITFKRDRSFHFVLDGKRYEWALPFITGLQLKRLAGVDPDTYGVWLAQRVGDDRLINNNEHVDLTARGVERFFTGIDTTTEGAGAVLPPEDREYLEEQAIAFEERNEAGQKALVLKAHSLPAGRFDVGQADILILLPPGYPDCAPDMFYLMPWARLAGGRYPKAADQPQVFAGQTWQRWSRHNTTWRPGVDGIWTMLRRIERALEIAA